MPRARTARRRVLNHISLLGVSPGWTWDRHSPAPGADEGHGLSFGTLAHRGLPNTDALGRESRGLPAPRLRPRLIKPSGSAGVMPCRAGRVRRQRECHLYFARRMSFLSCADIAVFLLHNSGNFHPGDGGISHLRGGIWRLDHRMRDRVEKGRGDTLIAPERRGALPRTQAARSHLRASPGRRGKLRFAAIGRTQPLTGYSPPGQDH